MFPVSCFRFPVLLRVIYKGVLKLDLPRNNEHRTNRKPETGNRELFCEVIKFPSVFLSRTTFTRIEKRPFILLFQLVALIIFWRSEVLRIFRDQFRTHTGFWEINNTKSELNSSSPEGNFIVRFKFFRCLDCISIQLDFASATCVRRFCSGLEQTNRPKPFVYAIVAHGIKLLIHSGVNETVTRTLNFVLPMEQQFHYVCLNCNAPLVQGSRFCTVCGMKHTEKQEIIEHHVAGEQPLLWPIACYVVLLVYCLIIRFSELSISPVSALVTDILFAIIVLAFTLRDIQLLKNIFTIEKFNWLLAGGIVLGSVVAAIGVNWLADRIDELSGIYYEVYMFNDSQFPILLSIVSTAFFPAFFEELAFRGLIYSQLRKVMGITATIVVTAVAFSILHLSPISLIWIFPLGLLTGWLRSKHETIWYGIILHFTYNTTIVLLYFWANRYFS
jgi:membrane protease YdiL (CAAX protease family)